MREVVKAWRVKEKYTPYATVVFAETRGKAKSLALCTDACQDADFCDIETYREPQLDKYYAAGKTEMEWDNPQDRIALVRDGGFACCEDCFSEEECLVCPANKYCDRYIDCVKAIKDLAHRMGR